MAMISMRLPIAFMLGATLMAWRAFEIAPQYSAVQVEMLKWMMLGALLLAVAFFWELLRWYRRMDRQYIADDRR